MAGSLAFVKGTGFGVQVDTGENPSSAQGEKATSEPWWLRRACTFKWIRLYVCRFTCALVKRDVPQKFPGGADLVPTKSGAAAESKAPPREGPAEPVCEESRKPRELRSTRGLEDGAAMGLEKKPTASTAGAAFRGYNRVSTIQTNWGLTI